MAWGLKNISSHELTEWRAYWALLGDKNRDLTTAGLVDREDLRTAMLMSLLANINRDTKQRRKLFTPADFMLDYGRLEDEESEPEQPKAKPWQNMLTMVEVLNAAFGGKDKRKKQ